MNEYCTVHGTLKVLTEVSSFNQETGQKNSILVCKTCQPCTHEHTEKMPWYSFFDYRCVDCGEKFINVY